MTDELRKLLERVRQNRAARTPAQRTSARSDTVPAHGRGGAIVAGGQVFDLVTGEYGEVLGAGTENVIVPTADVTKR